MIQPTTDSQPRTTSGVFELSDSELGNLEWAVIEKALEWDVLSRARHETWPEDEELHFAIRDLIVGRKVLEQKGPSPIGSQN